MVKKSIWAATALILAGCSSPFSSLPPCDCERTETPCELGFHSNYEHCWDVVDWYDGDGISKTIQMMHQAP